MSKSLDTDAKPSRNRDMDKRDRREERSKSIQEQRMDRISFSQYLQQIRESEGWDE